MSHTCQGFVICLSCKKGQTSVLSLFRKRLAFGMCGGQHKLPFTASAGGAEVRAAFYGTAAIGPPQVRAYGVTVKFTVLEGCPP